MDCALLSLDWHTESRVSGGGWSRVTPIVLACTFAVVGYAVVAGPLNAASAPAAVTSLSSAPAVDVGHESAGLASTLANEVAAPGPHVDVAGGHGGTGDAAAPAGSLVPGLATAYSNTWQPVHGPRVTRVYAAPVNYQDSSGRWQPISNSLTAASGGGYENKANRFALHVPSSLASPVSLTQDGRSVQFALQGAQGTAAVSGDDATFARALSSASVTYRSQANGVSEQITLKNAAAPRSLRFRLSASHGLVARRLADGTVELVDARGKVRFVIPASFAYRSGSGAGKPRVLASKLSAVRSGWVLTVDTGAAWLRKMLAAGPVVVDPSVLNTSAELLD